MSDIVLDGFRDFDRRGKVGDLNDGGNGRVGRRRGRERRGVFGDLEMRAVAGFGFRVRLFGTAGRFFFRHLLAVAADAVAFRKCGDLYRREHEDQQHDGPSHVAILTKKPPVLFNFKTGGGGIRAPYQPKRYVRYRCCRVRDRGRNPRRLRIGAV